MYRSICVIPARLASSRFPRKPLAPILGMPMIGHVALRCKLQPIFSRVVVATCDQDVVEYCRSIDVEAVMTSSGHERASDRVQEATQFIEQREGIRFDFVVMVQGDEPMVTPSMLRRAVESFHGDPAPVSNLCSRILTQEEFASPNCVKVVRSLKGDALYFSRAAIPDPSHWKGGMPTAMKQVCIISFTRAFLDTFSALSPTYLEQVESIDMNRVLDHGYRVACLEINEETYPVDVPADLVRVENLAKNDPLLREYMSPR